MYKNFIASLQDLFLFTSCDNGGAQTLQGGSMENGLTYLPSLATGSFDFILPNAEYTSPVIYRPENSARRVFRVEVSFEESAAKQLHPGQPVELIF